MTVPTAHNYQAVYLITVPEYRYFTEEPGFSKQDVSPSTFWVQGTVPADIYVGTEIFCTFVDQDLSPLHTALRLQYICTQTGGYKDLLYHCGSRSEPSTDSWTSIVQLYSL